MKQLQASQSFIVVQQDVKPEELETFIESQSVVFAILSHLVCRILTCKDLES